MSFTSVSRALFLAYVFHFQLLTVSAVASTLAFQIPSQIYAQDTHNLVTTAEFNCNHIHSNTSQTISINIELPNELQENQQCYTLTSGQTQCSMIKSYRNKFQWAASQATVSSGSSLILSSTEVIPVSNSNPSGSELGHFLSVTFSADTSGCVGSIPAADRSVSVTLPVSANSDLIGTSQTITAEVVIGGGRDSLSSVTVSVVGVELLIATTATMPSNVSDIEGGASINYDVAISHSGSSTEDATNVIVTVNLDDDHISTIDTAYHYSSSAGNPVNFQLDSPYRVTLTLSPTTLRQSESFYFHIVRNLTDALPLGQNVKLITSVNCADASAHTYTFTGASFINPQSLLYTQTNGNNIDMFKPGQSYSMSTSFRMPKGALVNLKIFGEFDSASLSSIPLNFINASLEVPISLTFQGSPVLTRFSSQNHRSRRSIGQGSPHNRVKRMAGGYRYTSGTFGTVTNPNPGHSPGIITASPVAGLLDLLVGLGVFFLVQRRLLGCRGNHLDSKNSGIYWLLTLTFTVGGNVRPGNIFSTIGLAYGTTQDPMMMASVPVSASDIQVFKSVESVNQTAGVYPSKVRFTSVVNHSALSNLDATNLTLADGSTKFDIFFGENFSGPAINDPNFDIIDDRIMSWKRSPFVIGDTMVLSYVASPTVDLLAGENWIPSVVSYRHYVNGPLVQVTDSVCIYNSVIIKEQLLYQYGFTVLFVLVGLIAGALVVILIIFIVYKVRRRPPFESGAVRPISAVDTKAMQQHSKSGGLVTNARTAMKKGVSNLGTSMYDDSIVFMLSIKDKLKALRTLDKMDINSTSRVDQQLENERNQAMMDATRLLLDSLMKNGDIPAGVKDKAWSNFQKKANALDKDLNDTFKKDMEKLLRTLSSKNKDKLASLMEKQEEERENLKEKTRHMGKEEQDELMALLKKQQQTEMDELTHLLELEQKEELEKLRKEKIIRKRMGLKGLQQEALEEVKANAKLSPEQCDWLMKEHFKNQAALEKIYDDEVSRQRMVLEEKLARRRALADNKDMQEDAESEALNLMAEQQIGLVMKAKKGKVLSASEAQVMIDDVQRQMLETKKRLDGDREKQETALHKKLSERKKQRMEELMKKQKQEMSDLDKKHAQTQAGKGYIDPVAELQGRQVMRSHHRSELVDLENEIDKEDAQEYAKLREDFSQQTKNDLNLNKDELVNKLAAEGMSDDKIQQILSQHKLQEEELQVQQEKDKQRQIKKFKQQLNQRQAEWQQRRLEEQVEQENLREHEENVIRKLMDNQVALSETERDRILQEHEKQMVTMENSLTLNKLQQQRMLEDKLAKKRALQLEKLQKKQARELKKTVNDDDDDEESSELEMMRRHMEDKMGVLRGDNLQLDDEVEQIRGAMMKERANALKEQEVKLGAMLAQLQMDKAKEMARIEEQQKAIHSLKSSLMDDLNEKGMLSDPECQKVIQIHQKEQEKLNSRLEDQRAKQEKVLQQRLQARLKQKEQQLGNLQKQEMEESGKSHGQSAASKLKRAALATKHMVQVEKFRNRMENEIGQTLQEMKRQNELRRIASLQDQEIQFINGLVRLGKFNVDELQNVTVMLFPNKTEAERKILMDKIMEGISTPGPKDAKDEIDGTDRTLEQRVLANTMAKVEMQTDAGPARGYKKILHALRPGKNKNRRPPVPETSTLLRRKSSTRDNNVNNTLPDLAVSAERRTSTQSRKLLRLPSDHSSSASSCHSDSELSSAPSSRLGHDIKRKPKKRGSMVDDIPNGRKSTQDNHRGRAYGQVPPSKLPPLEAGTGKKKKKNAGRTSYEADF